MKQGEKYTEQVDFKSGEIVYNEFWIDFDKAYSEQMDCLTEDLLQVKFPNGYLLDIGWYPECDIDGEFLIQLIKSENWEVPVCQSRCRKKKGFIQNLNQIIQIAEHFIES